MNKGMSLIEIMIVVTIFAIMGVLISSSIILTLQGSKKSENLVSVRENLDYAMNVVERQVRNAESIDCKSWAQLDYTDQNGKPSVFWCWGLGSNDSYIASGSGNIPDRLTDSSIEIINCGFTCYPEQTGTPAHVDIYFEGKTARSVGSGIQSSSVTVHNQIYLRDY